MEVFDNYARYYNLLYQDKDYKAESDYVLARLKGCGSVRSILDVGCGTGRHAICFASAGLDTCGIDLSPNMIAQAKADKASLPADVAAGLDYHLADARDFNLNRKFDAIVSLFHVVSYQTANSDVMEMFRSVRNHLEAGGLFFFDYWYGPAVLTIGCETRQKVLADDRIHVLRKARPEMLYDENCVNVNYDLTITDKGDNSSQLIHETHTMRYFFLPEQELFCQNTGFEMLASYAWPTGRQPGPENWAACTVARAI